MSAIVKVAIGSHSLRSLTNRRAATAMSTMTGRITRSIQDTAPPGIGPEVLVLIQSEPVTRLWIDSPNLCAPVKKYCGPARRIVIEQIAAKTAAAGRLSLANVESKRLMFGPWIALAAQIRARAGNAADRFADMARPSRTPLQT